MSALVTPSERTESPACSEDFANRSSPESSHTKRSEEKATKRRAHRKSRFGCKNCKARRIKCDEKKPGCTNCIGRQVRCDYLPSTAVSSSTQAGAAPSPAEAPATPGPSRKLDIDDVELMYHWTTSTSATLSSQASGITFWRTQVTELALTHHHILHLILAFTAIHLSRSRTQRREEYLELANHHYAAALPKVTAELSHLDQDNCDAVLLSVQFLSCITWARGPQPGEYLAFGINGRSSWLAMFRGIRTTYETVGYENFTRSGAPSMRAIGRPLFSPNKFLDYEKPLAELGEYVRYASQPSELSYNVHAYQVLLECYSNRYGGVDTDHHLVFAWLFRAQDEFLDALQRHDAVPLVVYAHFAVLMNDMEGFWYMKGWTTHVLAGIWGLLQDEERVHVRWPASVVGWIPP